MDFAKEKLRKVHVTSGHKEWFSGKHEQGFEFQEWNYIPEGVKVEKEVEGEIRVFYTPPSGADWILNFWFQTEFTNCARVHYHDSHHHEIDVKCNEGGKFQIYINDSGPYFLKGYSNTLPRLNLRIFERQIESKGYVELGCAVLQQGENELVNQNKAVEGSDNVITAIKVDTSLNLPPPHKQQVFNIFASKERASWVDHMKYFPFVSAILEPCIGYHTYIIPRSYFHLPFHRKPYFSENWLYACIFFTYKLFGVEPPTTTPTTLDEFVEKMTPIAQAFPLFISRLLYTPDNLRGQDLEIYSRDVLLIGGGDCEDFAYLLCEIFLYLRNAKFTLPLMQIVQEMVQFYIPGHVLCQASQPKMVAGVTEKDKFIYDFSQEAFIKAQKEMKHFHVFCQLYPVTSIASYFSRTKKKEEVLKILNFQDKEKIKLCDELTRMALEGTSSIYSYHCEEGVLDQGKLKDIAEVIDKGEEPFVGYTFRNFPGASRMYGAVIQVGSEEFYKITGSGLACATCEIDHVSYLGPADPFFSVREYDENIHFIHSTEVETAPEFMEYIDPPYPILDLDLEEFKKEVAEADFTPSSTRYWTAEKTKLPYLPYNLVAPAAKPIYIAI